MSWFCTEIKTVFLVDDVKINNDMNQRALGRHGIKSESFHSGEDLFIRLKECKQMPDIILLDINVTYNLFFVLPRPS